MHPYHGLQILSMRGIVYFMAQPLVYLLLLLDVVLTVSAQLALRAGALRLATQGFSLNIVFEPLKNIFLLLGVGLYAVSFFLYIFILSRLQLNIVYPVATGAVLVIIAVTSHFWLNESITVSHIVGIVAILIGIVFILLPK